MKLELTPEQSQALAAEGEQLVLVDPRTQQGYRLVSEEKFLPVRAVMIEDSDEVYYEFPEPILKARAAMRRDLPALLKSWWTRGKWACYTAQGKVGVSRNFVYLIRECNKRGIPETDYIIERIKPGAVSTAEEWPGPSQA